jgi:hypothetical protein
VDEDLGGDIGVTDAAAIILTGSRQTAKRKGRRPIAIDWAASGRDGSPRRCAHSRHSIEAIARACSSMSVFDEHMRWVTCIAAPILLADVGNHRFGVLSLDLKSCDECIFGVHGDVVRLPIQFNPDGKLHQPASSANILGQTFIDVQPMRS